MQRRKVFKAVTVGVVIGILVLGNLYLYQELKKPDFMIRIGTPVNTEMTYIGEGIKDKEDARNVVMTVIRAEEVDKPACAERLPDAEIWFDDWKVGVSYMRLRVWLEGDDAYFGNSYTSLEDDGQYKRVLGSWTVNNLKIGRAHV